MLLCAAQSEMPVSLLLADSSSRLTKTQFQQTIEPVRKIAGQGSECQRCEAMTEHKM